MYKIQTFNIVNFMSDYTVIEIFFIILLQFLIHFKKFMTYGIFRPFIGQKIKFNRDPQIIHKSFLNVDIPKKRIKERIFLQYAPSLYTCHWGRNLVTEFLFFLNLFADFLFRCFRLLHRYINIDELNFMDLHDIYV